ILAALAFAVAVPRLHRRLQLSRAKHLSLRGHARWSRRIAGLIRFFEYGEDEFLVSDAAPESGARERREGLERLRRHVRGSSPSGLRMDDALHRPISGVQVTAAD